jgi:DNA-binding CsgD family transcriptional regulator/pimeloyl-ACP methyl ester carboxylesterase
LWGGAAAASLASIAYSARHPQRVTHLVLSAPIARGRLHPNSTPQEQDRFLAFVKLIELGWGENNPAFRQILCTQMFPRATTEQMDELTELFRISASPRHAARMAMATGQADVSALLPQIACPALILHCRGSVLIPIEEARLIASSIPHARLVMLDTNNYLPLEGEQAFGALVAEFDAFLPRQSKVSTDATLTNLTRREREVLNLLARGLDNSDIATHLEVAEKTVRNTVSHIFDKLSVKSRAQAIVLARQAGLGD